MIAFALVVPACAPAPARAPVDTAISFERVARPVLRVAARTDTRDPSLAFDAGGSLWIGAVTGGKNPGYALFRSPSLGDRFELEQVAPVRPGMLTGGQLGPRFVLDSKEFSHLIYATEQARRHDVVVARRRWFESGWTGVSARGWAADSRSWGAFADLAVAPDGRAFATLLDERNHHGPSDDVSEVWLARTDDDTHVTHVQRVGAHTCSCCRTAVATRDGRTIFVAYRGDFDRDQRDMTVVTSHDGGVTFDPPVRIAQDGWSIHGCPESGPSLLLDGMRLRIAWFTLGADARPRVLVSHSDDDGKTFAAPVEVSGAVLDANYPRLAAAKPAGALVTFVGRDPADGGFGKIRAWIVRLSGDDRSAPQAVTPPSLDVSDPVAIMPNATVVAVAANGTTDVVLVRGRVRQ
jgi:hypothetical protein